MITGAGSSGKSALLTLHDAGLYEQLNARRRKLAIIDMLCINRNLAIVFDHDNDFTHDAQGQLVCVNTASTKYRVLANLNALKELRFHAWVTDGYTIESYLPDELRTRHFDDQGGRLVLKPHHRKVEIAMQY